MDFRCFILDATFGAGVLVIHLGGGSHYCSSQFTLLLCEKASLSVCLQWLLTTKKKKKSVRYLDGKQKLYSQSWSYKHSRLSTKQKHTQTPTSPTPPALLKKSDWTHRCSFHSSWLVEKFEVLDATIYYLSLLKENKSTEILLRFLRTVYVWRLYVCADTYSIVLRFSL